MATRSAQSYWLLSLIFIFHAAWLGMRQLDSDLFWFDEMIQLHRSTGDIYGPVDFAEVLSRVRGSQSWPPVHSFAAAAWGMVSGWSGFATRYLSLEAGLLSIAVAYALGRDMFSRQAGLIAAVLMASAAFFIYYMHEFRGYTMLVLFSTASVWFYWRTLVFSRHRNVMRFLLFMSLLLTLHTHYGAVFTPLIIGLYHLFLKKPRNRSWLITLLVIGAAAVAFIPWVVYALQGVVEREMSEPRGLPPSTALSEIVDGYSNGLWFIALPLVGFALLRSRNTDRAMLFMMSWLFLGLIFLLGLNQYAQFMFHVRHALAFLVPVVLLVAVGLSRLPARWWWFKLSVIVLWVGLGLVYSQSIDFMRSTSGFRVPMQSAPMRAALATIRACVDGTDAVVFMGPDAGLDSERFNALTVAYYAGDTSTRYGQINNLVNMAAYDPGSSYIELFGDYASAFDDLIDRANEVWVFGLVQPTLKHAFLPEFQQLISKRYDYGDLVIHTPDLIAYVYSNDAIVSCDEVNAELPPSRADLISTE